MNRLLHFRKMSSAIIASYHQPKLYLAQHWFNYYSRRLIHSERVSPPRIQFALSRAQEPSSEERPHRSDIDKLPQDAELWVPAPLVWLVTAFAADCLGSTKSWKLKSRRETTKDHFFHCFKTNP